MLKLPIAAALLCLTSLNVADVAAIPKADDSPGNKVAVTQRGFIGVHVKPELSLDGSLEVIQVIPSSTAATAGIRIGDKIISINGIITSLASLHLTEVLNRTPVGGDVTFIIERDGIQKVLNGKMLTAPKPEDIRV